MFVNKYSKFSIYKIFDNDIGYLDKIVIPPHAHFSRMVDHVTIYVETLR